MKDILKNQAKMTAVLAANYTELKRTLEAANTVNKQQMDVVVQSRDSTKADLEDEQAKHVQARADLHNKVTDTEAEIETRNTEIAAKKCGVPPVSRGSDQDGGGTPGSTCATFATPRPSRKPCSTVPTVRSRTSTTAGGSSDQPDLRHGAHARR